MRRVAKIRVCRRIGRIQRHWFDARCQLIKNTNPAVCIIYCLIQRLQIGADRSCFLRFFAGAVISRNIISVFPRADFIPRFFQRQFIIQSQNAGCIVIFGIQKDIVGADDIIGQLIGNTISTGHIGIGNCQQNFVDIGIGQNIDGINHKCAERGRLTQFTGQRNFIGSRIDKIGINCHSDGRIKSQIPHGIGIDYPVLSADRTVGRIAADRQAAQIESTGRCIAVFLHHPSEFNIGIVVDNHTVIADGIIKRHRTAFNNVRVADFERTVAAVNRAVKGHGSVLSRIHHHGRAVVINIVISCRIGIVIKHHIFGIGGQSRGIITPHIQRAAASACLIADKVGRNTVDRTESAGVPNCATVGLRLVADKVTDNTSDSCAR